MSRLLIILRNGAILTKNKNKLTIKSSSIIISDDKRKSSRGVILLLLLFQWYLTTDGYDPVLHDRVMAAYCLSDISHPIDRSHIKQAILYNPKNPDDKCEKRLCYYLPSSCFTEKILPYVKAHLDDGIDIDFRNVEIKLRLPHQAPKKHPNSPTVPTKLLYDISR